MSLGLAWLLLPIFAACGGPEGDGSEDPTWGEVDTENESDLAENGVGETASPLNATFPLNRVARIVGKSLQVKQDVFGYITIHNSTAQAALTADRVVVRHTDGSVWAKDGSLSSAWVRLAPAGSAVQVAAAASFIAMRTPTGAIRVKRGALTAGWVTYVASGAKWVELAGCGTLSLLNSTGAAVVAACDDASRIGYIDANYTFRARTMKSGWVIMGRNVAQISMAGTRMGMRLRASGDFYTQSGGSLTPAWVLTARSTLAGAVGLRSTGRLSQSGSLLVKSLGGDDWVRVPETFPITSFSLLGSKIAVRTAFGELATWRIGRVSNSYKEAVVGREAQGFGAAVLSARTCRVSAPTFDGFFIHTGIICE